MTRELDSLRTSSAAALEAATRQAADEAAAAAAAARTSSESDQGAREAQLHSLTQSVEALKAQLGTWQTSYHDEKSRREESEANLERLQMDHQSLSSSLAQTQASLQREQSTSRNLQLVLEDLQADQEAELQRSLGDYQRKYEATAMELEELKVKAKSWEKRCNEGRDSTEKAGVLEKEVREKNLLIGKLRHEGECNKTA